MKEEKISKNELQELESILFKDLKFNEYQINQVMKIVGEELQKKSTIIENSLNDQLSYAKKMKTSQKRIELIKKILNAEETYLTLLRSILDVTLLFLYIYLFFTFSKKI